MFKVFRGLNLPRCAREHSNKCNADLRGDDGKSHHCKSFLENGKKWLYRKEGRKNAIIFTLSYGTQTSFRLCAAAAAAASNTLKCLVNAFIFQKNCIFSFANCVLNDMNNIEGKLSYRFNTNLWYGNNVVLENKQFFTSFHSSLL